MNKIDPGERYQIFSRIGENSIQFRFFGAKTPDNRFSIPLPARSFAG
jgi:hypothetical protein